MADEHEVPEADALEQALEADDAAVSDRPIPTEASEADVVDQHQDTGGGARGAGGPRLASEVPEADAVEQAQVVPDDDEGWSE